MIPIGAKRSFGLLRAALIPLFLAAGAVLLGCGGGGVEEEELPPGIAQMGETPAGAVLLDSIRAHGGWSAWSKKESVEYESELTSYNPDGSPGIAAGEIVRLMMTGRIRGRVDRQQQDVILAYNGHVGWVTRDSGTRPDLQMQGAAQAYVQRIHWVFRLPFNLVGVDVRLGDDGSENGMRKIRIQFPVGMGVLENDWSQIYIDEKTHLIRELFMNSAKGRSWMEFDDYREVEGILLPHRRRVYKVTGKWDKGILTHEIKILKVKFNQPLEDTMFDPPEAFPRQQAPPPGFPAQQPPPVPSSS